MSINSLALINKSKSVNLSNNLFKKQIAKFGVWVHPQDSDIRYSLDEEWAKDVINNFRNKVAGRIPVPLTHTNDPQANAGELVDLSLSDDGSGLDGVLEIRRTDIANDIRDELIMDVSIAFEFNYKDEAGKNHGPTITHVALVNNPYLVGMKPFETLAEMSRIFTNQFKFNAIMLSNDNRLIEKGENIMAELSTIKLKNEKDTQIEITYSADDKEQTITVEAGAEFEVPADQEENVKAQMSNDEDKEEDNGNNDDTSEADEEGNEDSENESEEKESESEDKEEETEEETEDEVEDKSDIVSENARLKKELAQAKADKQYETLLKQGKIVPAQKEAFMALSTAEQSTTEIQLSKDKTIKFSSLISTLLEAGPAKVQFSEDGKDNDNNNKDNDPVANLDDGQKAALDRMGISHEDFAKYGNGVTTSAGDLTNKE